MQIVSQISLSKEDIEAAIKLYIASSGMSLGDTEPEITIANKRGALTASIEISTGLKANLGPIELDVIPGKENDPAEKTLAPEKPAAKKEAAPAKPKAAAKKAAPKEEPAAKKEPKVEPAAPAVNPFGDDDGGTQEEEVPTAPAAGASLFANENPDDVIAGESDELQEDESPSSSDDNLFG